MTSRKEGRHTGLDEGMVPRLLVLLFQEREPVKLDHPVGDAVRVERVTDGLRDEQDDLSISVIGC